LKKSVQVSHYAKPPQKYGLQQMMLNMPIIRTNDQHQSFEPLVNNTVDY